MRAASGDPDLPGTSRRSAARNREGVTNVMADRSQETESRFDRLLTGDCLPLLASLPRESVDLVFADPPFNIGHKYDVYEDCKSVDEYLAWSKRWINQIARVLKPAGTFWLAIGDEFAAELKVAATRTTGFFLRSWVVWHYTFGVNCTRKFTRSHTHLLYFVKDPKSFTFNDETIRVPSWRQQHGDKRANPKGRIPDDTWILRPQDAPESFAADHDTWHVPRVCGTHKERVGWHGCQMPERILERIMRACSNPGDTVLDPFAGSGTTLVVAKKLGRRYLGCELSADYARLAQDRLDAAANYTQTNRGSK